MLKKIGRFFEEHIEKIILVIVGVLCVLLFIWRVLLSPNMVEIVNNDGKTEKLSPVNIDDRVYQEAKKLNQMQDNSYIDPNLYEPKTPDFLAVLNSALGNINTQLAMPNPEIITPSAVARGPYVVPESIGRITEVAIEHIRAAAYVPIEPVTEQRTYDQVEHEPNDIDLVTVEGKLDIASVYSIFNECFVDQVEEQWADPCLAIPIFASVNLQRRELMSDGTWSDWGNVKRTQIDQHKNMFENIGDGRNLPPGGLKVQMLQFNNKQVQIDLLQPEAYQMASAREEWFPPLQHKTYKTAVDKEKREERREARDSEQQQDRNRETTTRRSGRTDNTRSGSGRGGLNSGIGMDSGTRGTRRGGSRRGSTRGGEAGFSDGTTTGRGTRRRGSREDSTMMEMERFMPGSGLTAQDSPINEVYRDFNKIRLNWTIDLSKMREPLVFWHHDDTVEPEKSYQYKIRIGVFNPVAEAGKEEAVIWSEFSDVTNPVDIPGKHYFFVKSIQETAKTVTITVCKYVLGYWRSEDFRGIGPGEAIGGIIEKEPEESDEQPIFAGGDRRFATPIVTRPEERTVEPESINYDTGAVMIDVVAMNDWIASDGSNLSIRPYYDMLYSFDGTNIEHTPVNSSNWPAHMKREFDRVNRLSREEPEAFKAFGSSGTQRGTGADSMRGGEFDDMMYQDMMMDGGGLRN